MRLLLDTHIAIWTIQNSPKLSRAARDLILAPGSSIVVSAVSIWEIAIKHALSRRLPEGIEFSGVAAIRHFKDTGMALLPVRPEHAAAVADLPAIHKDPFDRLLVAQALHEPFRLITHDERVASYSDTFFLV